MRLEKERARLTADLKEGLNRREPANAVNSASNEAPSRCWGAKREAGAYGRPSLLQQCETRVAAPHATLRPRRGVL